MLVNKEEDQTSKSGKPTQDGGRNSWSRELIFKTREDSFSMSPVEKIRMVKTFLSGPSIKAETKSGELSISTESQ